MNPWLEWWLTSHRGWIALRKDWPLWLIGIAMMVTYEHFGGHRWWLPPLLLILPSLIKLAVAVFVVGWRKAIIPQIKRGVSPFLPRVK